MPFAGYLVSTGRFDLYLAATAGAIGCNLGSIVAYEVGKRGGRPLASDGADIVLIGPGETRRRRPLLRALGVGRGADRAAAAGDPHASSPFPPGVARMQLVPFHVYTFIGSWPWCFGLAWVGHEAGRGVGQRSAAEGGVPFGRPGDRRGAGRGGRLLHLAPRARGQEKLQPRSPTARSSARRGRARAARHHRLDSATRIAGSALSGEPASNGGCGSYSRLSCTELGMVVAADRRDQRQREVDPRGDAAAGHAVAVDHVRVRATGSAPNSARLSRYAQCVVARYPSSSPAAPRISEPVQTLVTHCACSPDLAHPGHRSRRRRSPAMTPNPPGTHRMSGIRAVGEGRGRQDREAGIGRHRIERLGDQIERRIAQPRQHLRRAGQVELGDVGKQQEGDMRSGECWP